MTLGYHRLARRAARAAMAASGRGTATRWSTPATGSEQHLGDDEIHVDDGAHRVVRVVVPGNVARLQQQVIPAAAALLMVMRRTTRLSSSMFLLPWPGQVANLRHAA
jgi:hypothetical protein